jgi:hypothetical protein
MLMRHIDLRLWISSALLLGWLAAPWPAEARPAPQEPETYRGEVTVREVGIVVEVPEAAQGFRLDPVRPEDFIVLEGGRSRPVTRVEPVDEADGGAWDVVVWIDRALAGPETAFASTLALANLSETLGRLGRVEVVMADPEPRLAQAGTGEAKLLRQVLADLAGESRVERDRAAGESAEAAASRREGGVDAARLGRQLDRLVTWLAARPSSGPRVLVLVMEGLALPPEQVARLERGEAGADDAGVPGIVGEAARALASYGWVTLLVPLQRRLELEEVTASDGHGGERDRMRVLDVGSERSSSVPPVIPSRSGKPSSLRFKGAVEALVLPETAALRALARPTAGTVVGNEGQLGEALQRLNRRWRVWYSAPDSRDGAALPVEVRLPGFGENLRAPAFVRSSIPPEVGRARVRRLLAGDRVAGDLPLSASSRRAGQGGAGALEVRLEVPAAAGAEPGGPARPGELRLSWGFVPPGGGAPVVRQETIGREGFRRESWARTARLEVPPGARKVAVVLEDLALESWGGAVVEESSGEAKRIEE